MRERIEQALDPLSKAIPLSPGEVSRARAWLIQAGYRDPRHLTIYVGSRLLALVWFLAVVQSAAVSIRPCCWSASPPWDSFFPGSC